MADLGLPFQGTLKYWIEDDYGSGPTGDALGISAKVQNVRVSVADKNRKRIGIDSPEADLVTQTTDISLHVEYVPHCDDTLLKTCLDRGSCGSLNSICFELGLNVSCPTAERVFQLFNGCKAKSAKISSSINNDYVIVLDFSVKSKSSPTCEETEEVESTPTGELLSFNNAGLIQRAMPGGAYEDIALILNTIDVTIDNGLKDYYDHASLEKQYSIEGELAIDGSCDISIDYGGTEHLKEVLNQDEFDIHIALGGDGCIYVQLHGCRWKSSDAGPDTSGDIMMESASFTAESVTIGIEGS